ncbi:hypothetical protein D3C75_863850 [compost metagenome]
MDFVEGISPQLAVLVPERDGHGTLAVGGGRRGPIGLESQGSAISAQLQQLCLDRPGHEQTLCLAGLLAFLGS